MSGTEGPDWDRLAEARQILDEYAADRAEIARLRAALAQFAERTNWYFEGDHMCPEWAKSGTEFPWDIAREALK